MAVAFDLGCEWKDGFIMNPTGVARVGYLVDFKGLGLGEYLKQDLEVFTPLNLETAAYAGITAPAAQGASGMKKVVVAGVLESFAWPGGVGDPVKIVAYVSLENAQQLQIKQQTTLKTTVIEKLSWWIVNFDEETKVWYEEAYPMTPKAIQGQLGGGAKASTLSVDLAGVVIDTTNTKVYKVEFDCAPAANMTYDLKFATSGSKSIVKGWGLKIGTLTAAAVPALK